MTFIDWLAAQEATGDPDRAAIIADAKAVVKLGGRQAFLDRLYIHDQSPTVKALRGEWEKAEGRIQ